MREKRTISRYRSVREVGKDLLLLEAVTENMADKTVRMLPSRLTSEDGTLSATAADPLRISPNWKPFGHWIM